MKSKITTEFNTDVVGEGGQVFRVYITDKHQPFTKHDYSVTLSRFGFVSDLRRKDLIKGVKSLADSPPLRIPKSFSPRDLNPKR